MSLQERLARLALWAYPAEGRTSSDAEVLATLLDAGHGSARDGAREAGSVLVHGAVLRSRRAYRTSRAQLALSAASLFAVSDCIWISAGNLRFFDLDPFVDRYDLWVFLLGVVPILAAVGLRRLAGMAGLAILLEHKLITGFTWTGWATAALLGIGFLAMVCSGRPAWRSRRRRGLHLLAVLLGGLAVLRLGAPPLGLDLIAGVAVLALAFSPALTLGLVGLLLAEGVIHVIVSEQTGRGAFGVEPAATIAFAAAGAAALALIGLVRRTRWTAPGH